jgi:methyl-accepting chemotaxis protein
MDEEKMQRQMEFIVEQQAQFAAKIGQLEENNKQTQENVKRTDENVTRLSGVVERLTGIVERVVDTVGRLAESTREHAESTRERFDETGRKIAALVDAQIQTEDTVRKLGERIDNLAAVVERHIVEGHNGRARPES